MPERLCLPRPLPPVEDDPHEEEDEDEDHAAQQRHEPRLGDQVTHVAVVGVAEGGCSKRFEFAAKTHRTGKAFLLPDDGVLDERGVHPEADRVGEGPVAGVGDGARPDAVVKISVV